MKNYLPLFTVILKDNPKISLTVTKTKKQAQEYIIRRLRLDHLQHFQLWCDLHDRQVDNLADWYVYMIDVLSKEQKNQYLISKIKMPIERLIATLRIYCKHVPAGCSYDDPIELETILNNLDEETLDKIEKEAEKFLQKQGE